MQRSFVTWLICLFLPLSCGHAPGKKIEQDYLIKSQPIASDFMATLKNELQQAVASGRFGEAIEVCKRVSKEKEEEFTQRYADIRSIRRISVKTRNPETHTPSPAEQAWLMEAEQRLKSGVAPQPGILSNESTVTVLFPIVINDPICLVCHGQEEFLIPDVQAALRTHYPNDQAVGYLLGDFRGALAIQWKE